MLADWFILSLKNVTIENKYLLPDYSGIYYVIDEEKVVWYIGQSRNLRNRWNGEQPHHRFEQLRLIALQQSKQFYIYFFEIERNQLIKQEKIDIYKYQPRLNYTPILKNTDFNDKINLPKQQKNIFAENSFFKIFSQSKKSIPPKTLEKPNLIMNNRQSKNYLTIRRK